MRGRISIFLLLLLTIISCKTPTDIVYFQNTSDLEKISSDNSFTPTFKVDDVVSILVSATDMDAARPFNLLGASIGSLETAGGDGNSNAGSEPTYLIDEQGNIEFPVLGKLKLAGLTRIEVKEMLKEKLTVYIKDPIVNVRLKNFKITVIGEVGAPGSFTIPNERITVIEALGLAGDLEIKGKRTNITVIREKDGENTYHKLDLTSKEIFKSPVYYLAQNDVLYVEPNTSRINESRTNNNLFGIVLSVVGVTLSILTFALR